MKDNKYIIEATLTTNMDLEKAKEYVETYLHNVKISEVDLNETK